MKEKIYNVGSGSQNLNKTQIIELIKNTIGDFEINILRDKKDPRDYRINFDRICAWKFKEDNTIDLGIKEMADELAKKKIDPYDKKFTNYK